MKYKQIDAILAERAMGGPVCANMKEAEAVPVNQPFALPWHVPLDGYPEAWVWRDRFRSRVMERWSPTESVEAAMEVFASFTDAELEKAGNGYWCLINAVSNCFGSTITEAICVSALAALGVDTQQVSQ